jgi:hypothetical protein
MCTHNTQVQKMSMEARRRTKREDSEAGAPDLLEDDNNEEEVTPPKAGRHAVLRQRLSGFMADAKANMVEKAVERKRKNDLAEKRFTLDQEEALARREQMRLLIQLVGGRRE